MPDRVVPDGQEERTEALRGFVLEELVEVRDHGRWTVHGAVAGVGRFGWVSNQGQGEPGVGAPGIDRGHRCLGGRTVGAAGWRIEPDGLLEGAVGMVHRPLLRPGVRIVRVLGQSLRGPVETPAHVEHQPGQLTSPSASVHGKGV